MGDSNMTRKRLVCFVMALCFAMGGFACGGDMGSDVKAWADKICACSNLKCANEALAKAKEDLVKKYSAEERKSCHEEALKHQKRAKKCHAKLK